MIFSQVSWNFKGTLRHGVPLEIGFWICDTFSNNLGIKNSVAKFEGEMLVVF